MATAEASRDTRQQLAALGEWLKHPMHMRVFATVVLTIVGYGVLYLPISNQLDLAGRELTVEQQRRDKAREIEHLRGQVDRFETRLETSRDPNEWVQYLIAGARQFPLWSQAITPQAAKRIAPFEAVVVNLKLEGEFSDMVDFIRWLETNDRLFRVDRISFSNSRTGELSMQLTVLGLMRSERS